MLSSSKNWDGGPGLAVWVTPKTTRLIPHHTDIRSLGVWQAAVNDHSPCACLFPKFTTPWLCSSPPVSLYNPPHLLQASSLIPSDFSLLGTRPSPGGPAVRQVLKQDILPRCAALTDSFPLWASEAAQGGTTLRVATAQSSLHLPFSHRCM